MINHISIKVYIGTHIIKTGLKSQKKKKKLNLYNSMDSSHSSLILPIYLYLTHKEKELSTFTCNSTLSIWLYHLTFNRFKKINAARESQI